MPWMSINEWKRRNGIGKKKEKEPLTFDDAMDAILMMPPDKGRKQRKKSAAKLKRP